MNTKLDTWTLGAVISSPHIDVDSLKKSSLKLHCPLKLLLHKTDSKWPSVRNPLVSSAQNGYGRPTPRLLH